jgi:hypothetical protein
VLCIHNNKGGITTVITAIIANKKVFSVKVKQKSESRSVKKQRKRVNHDLD